MWKGINRVFLFEIFVSVPQPLQYLHIGARFYPEYTAGR